MKAQDVGGNRGIELKQQLQGARTDLELQLQQAHSDLKLQLDVLDVGTGSGYGCALLVARLGAEHVTSVDVDPYLTASASERLDSVGLRPTVLTVDATGPLPGTYATVAVRLVPASWLAALRPGERLVTTIAGTGLILTADKTDDGGALGRIEWDRAGFMLSRHGPGYPPPLWEQNEAARDGEGEQVNRRWYPVLNVMEAWELWSMITVLVPGGGRPTDGVDAASGRVAGAGICGRE